LRDSVEELLTRFPRDREYSETGAPTILFECAFGTLSNQGRWSAAPPHAARSTAARGAWTDFARIALFAGTHLQFGRAVSTTWRVKLATATWLPIAVEIEQMLDTVQKGRSEALPGTH